MGRLKVLMNAGGGWLVQCLAYWGYVLFSSTTDALGDTGDIQAMLLTAFLFGLHPCSLLLYYSPGSMKAQFVQKASSPTAILGSVTALNLGEQERLVILGE